MGVSRRSIWGGAVGCLLLSWVSMVRTAGHTDLGVCGALLQARHRWEPTHGTLSIALLSCPLGRPFSLQQGMCAQPSTPCAHEITTLALPHCTGDETEAQLRVLRSQWRVVPGLGGLPIHASPRHPPPSSFSDWERQWGNWVGRQGLRPNLLLGSLQGLAGERGMTGPSVSTGCGAEPTQGAGLQ